MRLNKHTKLIISLLFAVLIIFAFAVTRFYFSVPDETGGKGNQDIVATRLNSDSDGNTIFGTGDGHYGLIDSQGRVFVAPEWTELNFAGDDRCIASKNIGGRTVYGCIDYDGNIIVPFVYSKITERRVEQYDFYTAENADSGETVVYDSSFVPCFRRAWEGCTFDGSEMKLTSGKNSYIYTITPEGFPFTGASLSGEALSCGYDIDVTSRVLLSKLTVPMLEKMTADVGTYLEYAYTGDDDLLSKLTSGSRTGFLQLFPEEHKILDKKLKGISDIYIYSVRADGDVPRYEAAIKADTEITYSDDITGETRILRDVYKASVVFSGTGENNLTAVSGGFALRAPDYPKPEQNEPQLGSSAEIPAAGSEYIPITTQPAVLGY